MEIEEADVLRGMTRVYKARRVAALALAEDPRFVAAAEKRKQRQKEARKAGGGRPRRPREEQSS